MTPEDLFAETRADAPADSALILRARSGDNDAFAELWRRHYVSGIAVARSVSSNIDPDDLVQEAYTRIFEAVRRGGGPTASFRAYLFTSIRNTAASWGRSNNDKPIDELSSVVDPDTTEQATEEALERSLTVNAFRSLPTRWQEVLWYTEIEQMKPNAVAPLLGLTAGGVSQLAFRAREGLREAWVQAHLQSVADGSECQWAIEHLGAHARNNLARRDSKRMHEHIAACARCAIVADEAENVSNRLALVLLPLVVGVSGAASYAAYLQGAGGPVAALVSMPLSVAGAAVSALGTGGGAGATAGAGATSGAGAGASAGTAAAASGMATAGTFAGMSALVVAGVAGVALAGGLAAASFTPTLFGADPAAAASALSTDGPSLTNTEVVEDTDAQDQGAAEKTLPSPPVAVPVLAPAPAVTPSTLPTPEAITPPQLNTVERPSPSVPNPQPVEPPPPLTGPGGEEPGEPGNGPGEQPGGETPGEQPGGETPGEQPGGETPGEQPGGENPGEETPGEQPGEETPGEQPGGENPGEQPGEETPGEQPGEETPGEQPGEETPGALPEGTPTLSVVATDCSDATCTTVVGLHGAPGATVHASTIAGLFATTRELNENGYAEVSTPMYLRGTESAFLLRVRYVTAGEQGPEFTISLADLLGG